MSASRILIPIGVVAVILSAVSAVVDLYARGPLPEVSVPGTWYLMGPEPPAPPSAGVRPGRPSMRGLGWQVIDYLSIHGVLVVNVETHRVEEASDIAVELATPLMDTHIEVLVYIRRPGHALAATRVQWTRGGGFIETDISVD